jgi:agmatinase
MPSQPKTASDTVFFGFTSFVGCELTGSYLDDDIDVVVSGVPFDLSTTERPGARLAPDAIRQASTHLAWEVNRWPWDFNVFDQLRLVDCGNLMFDPTVREQMDTRLGVHACHLLAAQKVMLTLGGDHSITLPILREYAKKYGSISLIQFDAHTDTEVVADRTGHHGTVIYEAVKEGLLNPRRSVQIGIRTDYIRDACGFRVLDAAWLMDHNPAQIISEIRRVVGNTPAYLTFDIDCLDPAFAPGTGTPVVGGLTTDLALKIIRGLAGCDLIGMDMVEVSPPFDHAEITALAAASLSLEFLYALAASRQAK